MVQVAHRTALRGSTFVRRVARYTQADVAPVGGSLSDRLGQWLDWKQSIALSTALDGKPTEVGEAPAFDEAQEAECVRVRASLVEAIVDESAWTRAAQRSAGRAMAGEVGAVIDYTPFRQRCLTLQRSMASATGSLRGRLRDMLAPVSPAMARLAELDAVMEMVLSPREQRALAQVPALLGTQFERQRDAAGAEPGVWLEAFRQEMQDVLLAELDVRFQPVEGLLAALRSNG